MTVEELLGELEGIDHARRVRAMVARATLTLPRIANAWGPGAARQRALLLVAALLRRDEPVTRATALEYCVTRRYRDTKHTISPRLFELVESALAPGRPAEARREAARALRAIARLCAPDDAARIVWLARALLPHRRLLETLCDALATGNVRGRYARVSRIPQAGSDVASVVQKVIGALARDPMTARLRLEMTINSLPHPDVIKGVAALARAGDLRADDLGWLCAQLENDQTQFDAATLREMSDAWRISRDERLRRLALATLRAWALKSRRWDHSMLARLRAFRAGRSPLVASAAAFVFPFGDSPEEPPLV